MKNNKLLKLDDYIEKSDKVDMSNYMPEITELYTYDGSYYAVPKDYDTIALWYNKKMFDDAGLEYPNENWTWDDLYEAAKKLTTGDKYGFCMNTSNDQDTYYNMVYSMGGYIVNDDHTKSGYDDANTIKAMDYVGKGKVLLIAANFNEEHDGITGDIQLDLETLGLKNIQIKDAFSKENIKVLNGDSFRVNIKSFRQAWFVIEEKKL